MSVNNEENTEKEENIDERITLIINELKGFQGILDSEHVKLSRKSLREWAGHINFCVTVIIEEFQNVRKTIEDIISEKNNNTPNNSKSLYI